MTEKEKTDEYVRRMIEDAGRRADLISKKANLICTKNALQGKIKELEQKLAHEKAEYRKLIKELNQVNIELWNEPYTLELDLD